MSKANETKKKNSRLWIAAAVAVVLIVAVILLIPGGNTAEGETPSEVLQTEATMETAPAHIVKETLAIQEIGKYTGLYVEDGSDEAVSGLLMMVVTNISAEPVQYAELALALGSETAKFSVSVLPAGGTAVLIEQNRMAWDADADYDTASVECVHLADFDKPLSMQEEKLEIQVLDGAINITNISGEDIAETIVLCYKNVANGVYHGGIAYRVRLEGGLKAGEIRQVMGTHFHQDGSEILFVDLVG